MSRPSWTDYFMDIADLVKTRSTCLRRQVGAVIVRHKRILSTGYNGAPMHCRHCEERGGCIREEQNVPSGQRQEICLASHAEQNAIAQAAYAGTSIKGATMYVTLMPCSMCAKMIINAGIVRVVCRGIYNDNLSIRLLKEAGIEIINLDEVNEK